MFTVLNAPRYMLVQSALNYGYDEREIKDYSIEQLRRLIWHFNDTNDDSL